MGFFAEPLPSVSFFLVIVSFLTSLTLLLSFTEDTVNFFFYPTDADVLVTTFRVCAPPVGVVALFLAIYDCAFTVAAAFGATLTLALGVGFS